MNKMNSCFRFLFLLSLFSTFPLASKADITGTVYNDVNADGIMNAGEGGVGGIEVRLFDSTNSLIANTTSSSTPSTLGAYTLSSMAGNYRIEFSIPSSMTYLEVGTSTGATAGTDATFVADGSTVNFAVVAPSEFCDEDNAEVMLACFASGDPDPSTPIGNLDSFASVAYNPTANTGVTKHLAILEDTGSIWGVAYDKVTEAAFVSSVLRRHAGFGPNGPGAIYRVTDFTGTAPSASPFVTISNAGTDPRTFALPTDGFTPTWDHEPFHLIGKTSLGDIDVSDDNETLWVINLNTKSLVEVDIGTGMEGNSFAIPDPGCASGAADSRPWAVKSYRGKVYVGVTCTAESSIAVDPKTEMTGHILEFDGTSFAAMPILSFPLNYVRESVGNEFVCDTESQWNPWVSDDTEWLAWSTGGFPCGVAVNSQPMLTDIEFDVDGSIIIAIADRFGMQWTHGQYFPDPARTLTDFVTPWSGGDLIRVCNTDTGYVVQGNAGCPLTDTKEFYQDDFIYGTIAGHEEIINGGIALLPGSGEVVGTVIDPLNDIAQTGNEYGTAGLRWFSNSTGLVTNSYKAVPQGLPGTLFKTTALGDVELLCELPPIEIGNFVWIDSDGDGIQDPGESPLAGVVVNLLNSSGALIETATTDASGHYLFISASSPTSGTGDTWIGEVAADIQPGTQYIIQIDPANFTSGPLVGYMPTTADYNSNSSNSDQHDSDGVDVTVMSTTFTGVSFMTGSDGSNDHTFDFGFNNLPTPTHTFTPVPPTATFTFTPIPPTPTFTPIPPTPTLTPMPTSTFTPISSTTPTLTPVPPTATPTVVAPSATPTMMPVVPVPTTSGPAVRIGDYVWFDTNSDGVQQSTESPVVGAVVNLVDPVSGSVISTTTTDANGFYYFDNSNGVQADGKYSVVFDSSNFVGTGPLNGFIPTTRDAGTNDAVDSDVYLDSGVVLIDAMAPSTGDNLSFDAGFVENPNPVRIGDYVWLDANKDGIQQSSETVVPGVVVNLVDPTSGTVIATTTTDANGLYYFDSNSGVQPDGKYSVVIDSSNFLSTGPLNGYIPTTRDAGTDDAVDSDVYLNNGVVLIDAMAPSTGEDLTFDAGFVENTNPVRIGDYVWLDTNKDGIQQPSETVVSGVVVNLVDPASGSVISTTTTDANGLYYFDSSNGVLPNGKYLVVFDSSNFTGSGPLSGYVPTTRDAGTNDGVDSDVYTNNGVVLIDAMAPATGEDLTFDAGFIENSEPVRIGDYVWFDANKDGLQQSSEKVFSGVVLKLVDPVTGTVIATTTTDANGFYYFDSSNGVQPNGKYSVEFDGSNFDANGPLSGLVPTTRDAGTDDGVDSDAYINNGVVLIDAMAPSTGENLTFDGGFIENSEPVRIGDYVWFDANKDGVQQPTERVFAGVVLSLVDPTSGVVLATTTTNADGLYYFDSSNGVQPNGKYSVVFDSSNFGANGVLKGFAPTVSNVGGDDTVDSDAYLKDGVVLIDAMAPLTGEDLTFDGGFIENETNVLIGDFVWFDSDLDGIQDLGEPVFGGVLINLIDSAGNLVSSTRTDANGFYFFTSLNGVDPNGKYSVVVDASNFVEGGVLQGLKPTVKDAGTSDSIDSDAYTNSDGVVLVDAMAPANGEDLTFDIGLIPLAPVTNLEELRFNMDSFGAQIFAVARNAIERCGGNEAAQAEADALYNSSIWTVVWSQLRGITYNFEGFVVSRKAR